jgi:hypothetical protein
VEVGEDGVVAGGGVGLAKDGNHLKPLSFEVSRPSKCDVTHLDSAVKRQLRNCILWVVLTEFVTRVSMPVTNHGISMDWVTRHAPVVGCPLGSGAIKQQEPEA